MNRLIFVWPQELTSPRLIKSHLPHRFLPSALHNGEAKVSVVGQRSVECGQRKHLETYDQEAARQQVEQLLKGGFTFMF